MRRDLRVFVAPDAAATHITGKTSDAAKTAAAESRRRRRGVSRVVRQRRQRALIAERDHDVREQRSGRRRSDRRPPRPALSKDSLISIRDAANVLLCSADCYRNRRVDSRRRHTQAC
ncbi:hypothetical protein EVAR_40488_1 [Eumeta japonica]|uniref:Uncharacterized protein n=1 Tax=Eumeta variegata TaxID=151549 RepID=A0A4C1XZM9_EUMVA|nr:hypothetical protein EVAR_40488_1 [Eumeta japonica]